MDLRSDKSFWPIRNGLVHAYPQLETSEETDVVILGGGITGALLAESFSRNGIQTIVVDKRKVAHGSTSASTALLQYEIDIPLYELQEKIGKDNANLAYHLCADSITYIENIINTLDTSCSFKKRHSLYFAQSQEDSKWLYKEYQTRKAAGFAVSWLDKEMVKDTYDLPSFGAIRSEIGAQVDPYVLTYSLLKKSEEYGARIFERTKIVNIEANDDGVTLYSKNGATIKAKKLLFAVGYEAKSYLKEKTADLLSTYAMISEPVDKKYIWNEKALLWNTSKPYFYARVTEDNRILIGGEDVPFRNPLWRDMLIPWKKRALKKIINELLPDLKTEWHYAWAGTFGETKDGLPYIGKSPEWENAYFALGYGGNGITFSAIAAQALLDLYQGKKVPYLGLFAFDR